MEEIFGIFGYHFHYKSVKELLSDKPNILNSYFNFLEFRKREKFSEYAIDTHIQFRAKDHGSCRRELSKKGVNISMWKYGDTFSLVSRVIWRVFSLAYLL